MIAALIARIEQGLFEPPDSIIGKPLWKLLRFLRFPYALLRDFARGDLTLRAMSLIYTTLLSIVPLIALMFSLLKGLGYHEDLEPMLYNFLEPLGDKATELTGQVMGFVENIRTGVLTSVGLVFLIYTAISMVEKVEESFNFVWRVEQPRSLGRRLSEYLGVMLVGPAIIVAVLGLIGTVTQSSLVVALSRHRPFGWLLTMFGSLTPYIIVTGVFAFVYGFIPNTKVHWRSALIGGLAAGVAWAASGALLASFVARSSKTMLIYAGFAIVIFGLLWLYVSWLIVLLGAQLAFYVQNPRYLRPGRGEIQLNASLRERIALSIMYLIVHDYSAARHPWTINSLADHLELPGAALGPIVRALERSNLLLLAEDDTWVPARDPGAINLSDVLEAVRYDDTGARLGRIRDIGPAVEAAKRAEQALKDSFKGKTVKDLLEE
jgi:membrane protein